MPPATVFSSKYRIDFQVGGNANAKRDSLVDEGPLKVASDHLFVKLLPAEEVPALGGGEHSWSTSLRDTATQQSYTASCLHAWASQWGARVYPWPVLAATGRRSGLGPSFRDVHAIARLGSLSLVGRGCTS